MLTLKNLEGKPFPVYPDTQVNIHTGTVLISHEICPVGVSWSDCSSDLLKLIADKHYIAHISFFTITFMAAASTQQILQRPVYT